MLKTPLKKELTDCFETSAQNFRRRGITQWKNETSAHKISDTGESPKGRTKRRHKIFQMPGNHPKRNNTTLYNKTNKCSCFITYYFFKCFDHFSGHLQGNCRRTLKILQTAKLHTWNKLSIFLQNVSFMYF